MLADHDTLMDDLFGDSEAVQIPAAPPLHGLNQRLDDLSRGSCCQRLAYSREGAIAAISKDSKSISISILSRNPRHGTWSLKPLNVITPELGDEGSASIVHIAWSPLGGDLAIVDDAGQICIYRSFQVLGQMRLQPQKSLVIEHDFRSIVGFHWFGVFPHSRSTGVCWSATRTGANWQYDTKHSVGPVGPCNPIKSGNAFLSLSRGGVLKLFFALQDGTYSVQSCTLDGAPHIADAISHAAFAPDSDNSLMVAAYDLSRQLKVFRIHVNWKYNEKEPQEAPRPSLEVVPHAWEESCHPLSANSMGQDNSTAGGPDSSYLSQMTHLEFLAPESSGKTSGNRDSVPTILATFCNIPRAATMVYDPLNRYQNAASVVCRWHLKAVKLPPVLAVFDEIQAMYFKNVPGLIKSSEQTIKQELQLERLSDVHLHSIVLSQTILRHNTLLGFAMSDGAIEFRFRESMELASADGNYEEVSTLPQSGFSFPQGEPVLNVALSPNFCCALAMNTDGKVKLRRMEYSVDSLGSLNEDQPQFGAISALLASSVTSSFIGYCTVDDILAILPPDIPITLANAIAEQLFMACSAVPTGSIDFLNPKNQTTAYFLKSTMLQRCISFHYALSPMEHGCLSINAKLAWTLFNMKSVIASLYYCTNPEPSWRIEIANTMLGNIRYATGVVGFILQEISNLRHDLGDNGLNDHAAIAEKIKASGSPALLFIFCSLPRKTLRQCLNLLQKLWDLTNKNMNTPSETNPQLQQQWKQFASELVRNCPHFNLVFKTHDFLDQEQAPEKRRRNPLETLLVELDGYLARAYEKSNYSDADRLSSEMRMFVRAEISPSLLPIAGALLKKMEGLGRYYDQGALYRLDTSFLGAWGALAITAEKRRWDSVRKSEYGMQARVRRCPRCASVMEEVRQGDPAVLWMTVMGALRSCNCGNSWAVGQMDEERKSNGDVVRVKRERED
ncbi:hypothetical protein BT63DRAFT_294707 [Microthyrium microscopicum]|uniref:Mediator of RNA polymerase II transcription subunit 16 n=1 Tax=Microthyrium microscopicum TaxID=703497 RepID=A0A6A6U9H4_9PEZI|nr:hypothetical protein BT63DRAFT_294707 [Microthyrium microscopicum]